MVFAHLSKDLCSSEVSCEACESPSNNPPSPLCLHTMAHWRWPSPPLAPPHNGATPPLRLMPPRNGAAPPLRLRLCWIRRAACPPPPPLCRRRPPLGSSSSPLAASTSRTRSSKPRSGTPLARKGTRPRSVWALRGSSIPFLLSDLRLVRPLAIGWSASYGSL